MQGWNFFVLLKVIWSLHCDFDSKKTKFLSINFLKILAYKGDMVFTPIS